MISSPPFFSTKTRIDKCCNHVIFLCLIFGQIQLTSAHPTRIGSGGTNNILDAFNNNTQANFLETLCGKSIISKKCRGHGAFCPPPTFVESRGNAEQNVLFCRFFIQNSVTRLKWSFLQKTIFPKRAPL